MKTQQLPYDMGNAGDFIKHGLIAEFVEWWLELNNSDFIFLDPFAGRPYVLPPHPEVIRRLRQLPKCALTRAQSDTANRYYGSTYAVKNIFACANRRAHIMISDRNQAASDELLKGGFAPIKFDGFDREESFSIINCELPVHSASLLLLDPFDDFLPKYADSIISKLPAFILASKMPVVLFVLCEDWQASAGKKWQQLRRRFLSSSLNQLSIVCPKMPNSKVKGERHFNSETVLLLPADYCVDQLDVLIKRLHRFSDNLAHVLGQGVVFKCSEDLFPGHNT